MKEKKETKEKPLFDLCHPHSTAYLLGSRPQVRLTSEEAKKRCVVNLGKICVADMKTCDINEDGDCHRGRPAIIILKSDK